MDFLRIAVLQKTLRAYDLLLKELSFLNMKDDESKLHKRGRFV